MLYKISQKKLTTAREMLTAIAYANTRKEAEQKKKEFQRWARQEGFGAAAELLEQDWERMVTFYSFPKDHWKHLRTTAAKRYKKVENATAVIWKLLLVAQMRFRKLNAAELFKNVAEGAMYQDGIRVWENPGSADGELAV